MFFGISSCCLFLQLGRSFTEPTITDISRNLDKPKKHLTFNAAIF